MQKTRLSINMNILEDIKTQLELKEIIRIYNISYRTKINSIDQLISKTTIFLNINSLTTLPNSIKFLVHLRYLELYHSKLSTKEQDKLKCLLPNCKINFSEYI